MTEPTQDGPDEVWPEMLHEITPSERDICRALGWIEWPHTGRGEATGWCMRCHCGGLLLPTWSTGRPDISGHTSTLAGMTFYTLPGARRQREGGMLVSYIDTRGNEQRPFYSASKPRGGKRPHRTKTAVEAYLKLPAALASPLRTDGYRRPVSEAPVLMPMLTPLSRREPNKFLDICGQVDRAGRCGVAEARAELAAFGVDGSVPASDLPYPVTLGAPVIGRSARFLAGISGAKPTAAAAAPSWQHPEVTLSPILEEVAARGDLGDIGEAVRDRSIAPPVRLDRLGARVLVAEARALVAANDNSLKKVAA